MVVNKVLFGVMQSICISRWYKGDNSESNIEYKNVNIFFIYNVFTVTKTSENIVQDRLNVPFVAFVDLYVSYIYIYI